MYHQALFTVVHVCGSDNEVDHSLFMQAWNHVIHSKCLTNWQEPICLSPDQMIINDCITLWSLGGGPLKISTAPMAGNPRNPAMSPHTLP